MGQGRGRLQRRAQRGQRPVQIPRERSVQGEVADHAAVEQLPTRAVLLLGRRRDAGAGQGRLPQGPHGRCRHRPGDDGSGRGRRFQDRWQDRGRAIRDGPSRLLLQQETVREGRGEGRGHQDLGRLSWRGEEDQGRRNHPDCGRSGREVADALLLFLPRDAHRRRERACRREGRKERRLQERDLRRGWQTPARARRARAVPARLSFDQAHRVLPACSATARRRWT